MKEGFLTVHFLHTELLIPLRFPRPQDNLAFYPLHVAHFLFLRLFFFVCVFKHAVIFLNFLICLPPFFCLGEPLSLFTDELLLLCEPRNSNYDTFLQSLDNIMAYVVFPQNIVLVTYQGTDLFIRMILPFETGVFFFCL